MSTCALATTKPSDRTRSAPKALSCASPPQDGFAVANLGQRRRNPIAPDNQSAESAIHFRPISFHCWRHAPIAKQGYRSHHLLGRKIGRPGWDLHVRPRMHAYLATVCRDLRAGVVRVGGVAGSCSHGHNATANRFPSSINRADKEGVLEVDQKEVSSERSSASPRLWGED